MFFNEADDVRSRQKPEAHDKIRTACAGQFSTKAIRLEESSTKPAAVKARKPSERRS
jgi:hypothetical protein